MAERSMNEPKIITVVLEISDDTTMEALMAAYRNSQYIEGARILSVYEGPLDELINESQSIYLEVGDYI